MNGEQLRKIHTAEFERIMCATGDGWVTVDLKSSTNSADLITLKCSSVSGSIGCLVLEDFQERKEYFKQDGRCNHELPFPLPKIQL
jgi:hypothetical protein